MDHAQHRAEDFGVCKLAGSGHAVKNCGLNEIPAFMFRDPCVAPVEQHFCALLLPHADQRLDAFAALPRDHRSHLYALFESISYTKFGRSVGDGLAKGLLRFADGHGHRNRKTTLSGTSESTVG